MPSRLFLASTMLCASLAVPALAQVAAPHVVVPESSLANPGDAGKRAHTNTRILQLGDPRAAPPDLFGAKPELPPFPGANYETPASLACVYGLFGTRSPALRKTDREKVFLRVDPSFPAVDPQLEPHVVFVDVKVHDARGVVPQESHLGHDEFDD